MQQQTNINRTAVEPPYKILLSVILLKNLVLATFWNNALWLLFIVIIINNNIISSSIIKKP